MKLKFEFSADLPVKQSPSDIAAMTGLFPRAQRRALAFGWVVGGSRPERYWLADIRADGVTPMVLPQTLTEQFVAVTGRSQSTSGSYLRLQAFGFGDGVGLLLGNRLLYLFSDIEAEPQVIAIEAGDAFADVRNAEGQLQQYPLRCGHTRAGLVPVVFSGTGLGEGEGRHVALLAVDADKGRARWCGLDKQGFPQSPSPATSGFSDPRESMFPETDLGIGSPLILDCAYVDEQWLLYLGGMSNAYHRFGLAPSLLTRLSSDMTRHQRLFQASEDSFGRLCASGDQLILSPLRKTGPAKGRQSILRLDDQQLVSPVLPRGYSKHSLVEYRDSSYWLSPMSWGYQHSPLVCCSVA